MTDGQRRCLQSLVDDYTAVGFSRSQIEGAVRRLAAQTNPPPIDPQEMQDFIDGIPP